MRFDGFINIPNIALEAYRTDKQEAIEMHMKQAARAFVRAAIPKIPVQTGMARGSYLNIGRFLKVAIPIQGAKNWRWKVKDGKRYREKLLWYYPPGGGRRIPKTPESGAALTAFKFIRREKGNGYEYDFEINSKVFHYTLQDEMHVRSPTSPWQSMQAGREAWLAYMLTIKKRLPKLGDYIGYTTISFGRGPGAMTKKYGRLRIRKKFDGQ